MKFVHRTRSEHYLAAEKWLSRAQKLANAGQDTSEALGFAQSHALMAQAKTDPVINDVSVSEHSISLFRTEIQMINGDHPDDWELDECEKQTRDQA